MHSRQIFYAQPEPGKKASNRHSRAIRWFEKHKAHAAAMSATAGFSAALALYLLRLKQFNEEASRRDGKARELKKLNSSRTGIQSSSAHASNTDIDNFIESSRAEMAGELREGIAVSEALLLEMESDIAGASFVRDGCFFTAAFAAAMILGIVALKGLAAKEERKAALDKKPEEPPQPDAEEPSQPEEDIVHAETQIPAPEPKPEKFMRPEYYDEFFEDLKKSIREEMGSLGSEEAAEAFLCVMKQKEIEELLNWPEMIAVHIEKNRDGLREFLQERNIDPKHLFARLGREVTDLF